MRWLLIAIFMALTPSAWCQTPNAYNSPSLDNAASSAKENDTDAKYKEDDQRGDAGNAWPKFTPSDTYAQWIVALLTVVATGTSVWAVTLVRDSLKLTREATLAANAAAEIANRQFAAEHRPWLRTRRPVIQIDVEDGLIKFSLSPKNVGSTPAINIGIHVVANWDQLGRRNTDGVIAFAESSAKAYGRRSNQRTIFPNCSREMHQDQPVLISGGEKTGFVRVVYAAVYQSSFSDKPLCTSGEVIFKPPVAIDNVSDFTEVERFMHYGVDVAT